MTETVALVLAGGQGQRLWPLSRKNRPKQFVSVVSENTLIQSTVDRLLSNFPPERIFVSTTERYLPDVLSAGLPVPPENIILERRPLGPATAYVLAHAVIHRLYGPDVRVFTCASDHFVQNADEFEHTLSQLVHGKFDTDAPVIALGAVATEPDDRLGYIRVEETSTVDLYRAVGFVEKPSQAEAESLVQSGTACWNTAINLARSAAVLDVYGSIYPEQTSQVAEYAEQWAQNPDDRQYGYDGKPFPGQELEPFFTAGARVDALVRDFGWSDVGTWERVLQARAKLGGQELPPALVQGSKDVVAISTDGRPIVACGVEDLIIVSHDDAIYVLNRSVASSLDSVKEWRTAVSNAGEEGLL